MHKKILENEAIEIIEHPTNKERKCLIGHNMYISLQGLRACQGKAQSQNIYEKRAFEDRIPNNIIGQKITFYLHLQYKHHCEAFTFDDASQGEGVMTTLLALLRKAYSGEK